MDAELFVFLGDAVGYLDDESRCLQLLDESGALCQRGNHEAMMLNPTPESYEQEPLYGLEAARARLSDDLLEQVAAWPGRRELDLDGSRVLCLHGSPSDELCGYVYPDSDLAEWQDLDFDLVLMGNTHRPFVRGERPLFVNPGSVGLPRDIGSLGSFATYDTTTRTASIHRFPLAVPPPESHPAIRELFEREADSFVGELIA